MNKKIDWLLLCEDTWEAPPAGPSNVRPPGLMTIAYCDADLTVPEVIERRTINTPQVALSVQSQGFEDKPRSDTVGDASLDDIPRS